MIYAVVIALGIVVVFIYWYFAFYRDYMSGCDAKISFQKFLEIYENARHKVHLKKGHFYYFDRAYDMRGIGYNFYFSIPDTFRYEYWRKVREHKLEEDNKNYKMTEIEKAWEKDAELHEKEQMKNGNTN